MNLKPLPVLSDNYAWLAWAGDEAVVVDPGEAGPVLQALARLDLKLTRILCTHHHRDHVGGVEALKQHFGCTVYGPDDQRIPGLDHAVGEGDVLPILGGVEILSTPGHTVSDITFLFRAGQGEGPPYACCGDTLFSGGCGRLFEGTPEQMWRSLQKISTLPLSTLLCSGHEYTQHNLDFALGLLPADSALQKAATRVKRLRAENQPTLPIALEEEKRINLFLRAGEPELADALELPGSPPIEVFAELRRRRNHF